MESIELFERLGSGKGEARKLRMDKKVPGICYGRHMDKPVPVAVDLVGISAILRKSDLNALYTVESKDKSIQGQLILIKEKQTDPLTSDLVHIDFQAVNKDEPIKATVVIELVGKPKGAEEGGVLQQPNRTLEISCLPHKTPSVIEVDVSGLDINDSLHVNDIDLPEGVEVIDYANRTLAVVMPPREEEEEPVAAEAVAADEVEVSSEKGKKEDPEPSENKDDKKD